jgi:hypothetical protein
METIKLVKKTGKDGHLKLDVPTSIKGSEVEILLVIEKKGDAGRRYDFSDISGKLQWEGDAVSVQRKLRDEWE